MASCTPTWPLLLLAAAFAGAALAAPQQQPPLQPEDAVRKRLEPIVVCYVSSWAVYRQEDGAFQPSHVDPSLCSHIVYAFAGLRPDNASIVSLDRWNDLEENGGKGSFRKYTQLRHQKPGLKVTLAVGGWNEGSGNYSDMAADPRRRKLFVESAVNMLKEHDFDGLDLDWEYPTKRGGKAHDRENFVMLVKELREAFDREAGPGRWLLTSAIGASPEIAASAYDLLRLGKLLDLLHVMAYDYHGQWDNRAGVHAPLRGADAGDPFSVEKTLDYLLSNGAPPEKLVLGLPFYGRTFIAKEPATMAKFGLETEPQGMPGPYTKERGFMGYNEICTELQTNKTQWQLSWDERSSTPYAVRGRDLISFDDPRSIDIKVRYGIKRGLAGMMVWAMETDDFHGKCVFTTNHHNYPLLRTINKAIVEALEERENEIEERERNKDRQKGDGRAGSSMPSICSALNILMFVLVTLRLM